MASALLSAFFQLLINSPKGSKRRKRRLGVAGPWLGHHTKTYLKRQLLQPRSTTALRPKYCSSNHAKDKLLSRPGRSSTLLRCPTVAWLLTEAFKRLRPTQLAVGRPTCNVVDSRVRCRLRPGGPTKSWRTGGLHAFGPSVVALSCFGQASEQQTAFESTTLFR